ncbi:Zap1p [Saccharomyces paradoxus]|uniref:Zap1p n=1 Tax=Saccharomyces paradoxus TaxID=27291 RepID=A0A8B8UU31_SACPA|nr:Zap1 [Saccharomyces paradoxus]QHS74194.1 Zap1 [Saccharomyces paradoxus]
MDALTPRDSPKRDDSMTTTTAAATSAKPDALTMSKEGIVHGHIHNYNNLTYIHGHLHHSAPVNNSSASGTVAAAAADTAASENASGTSHDMSGNCHANEKCKEYTDCQHFEFLNYHNNSSLAKYNDTATYNSNNHSFANNFHSVASDPTSPQQNPRRDLPRRKDSWFNDDLILLPSSKKNKPNPQPGSDDCYCTPKILEICCEETHPKSETDAKQDEPDESAKKSKPEDGNDVIIFTDVKNDHLMPNFNVHDQYYNDSSHEAHTHNNDAPDSFSQLMSHLSEIDCNLTCDTPCTASTSATSGRSVQDHHSLNNDDIFHKYCKFCEENTDNQPCFKHMHLDSKQPQLPPKCSSLRIPTNTLQGTNNAYHEHILNTDMDLKILEDLCNISSLYEVPFGKHMSHHNHSYTGADSGGDDSSTGDHGNHGNGNQTMNLLLSSINRCNPKNNPNGNNNTTAGVNTTDHQHHHHRIQLHSHKPNRNSSVNNTGTSATNSAADLTNNDLNELISREYSYERFRNQSEPPLLPKAIHQNQKNRRSWPTKDLDPADFSSLEDSLSSSISPPAQTTSTINFNWCFREEKNNDLKCKWKECPESCNSLFDLQRHLLKDHVSQDFKDPMEPLACNWEDCDFLGDDTCSIVNHINCQHGINFDIQFANPGSLLPGSMSKEKHHLLHCPNPQTHEVSKDGEALDMASANDVSNMPSLKQLEQVVCKWDGCNKSFSNAQELNDHLEAVHLTRGKSEYQCLWHDCHRTFPQRQKLIRHLKVHSKYKPYKCKTCKRCFSSEETLVQHTRTHSGEKPYKCHICNKKFAISSSLKIHIRTHTGEKPLQCKICGKRFNESSNLSKHIKTHQKKYKCSDCSKSFDDLAKLNSHKVKCSLEKKPYL